MNGIWRAAWQIPVNATLGSEYRFELNAQDFDDGFRNIGEVSKLTSEAFKIAQAKLVITPQTNQTTYQVGFDSVKIRCLVTYPSGSVLGNGKVSLRMTHGQLNDTIRMTYDNSTGSWYAYYPLTLFKLPQIGSWTLTIEAADDLGNSGIARVEISVQPWFVILGIACLIVVIFLVMRGIQWFRRKHWKKVIAGLKNVTIPFRKPEPAY
jgi:hypothetical protein